MTCTFSAEQIQSLSAPLDRGKVRQREQGRSKVSYLEGWQVIAEANRIFGFDGWQRETVALRCVSQAERRIGREPSKPSDPPQRNGWGGHLHRPGAGGRRRDRARGQRRRPRHRRRPGPGP
jgi:hypothetical protein